MKRFFQKIAAGAAVTSALIISIAGIGAAYYPDEISVAGDSGQIVGGIYSLKGSDEAAPADSVGIGDTKFETEIQALGFIPVKEVRVNLSRRRYVGLGGNVVGIKMYTEGVIVVSVDEVMTELGSVTPGVGAGLREGDVIVSVNGEIIDDSDEFSSFVDASEGKSLALKVTRGTKDYEMTLVPAKNAEGNYKAGLWVRDSSAGVGTVSFTLEETGGFAALGHAVCDVDTGELMPLAKGEAVEAGIKGIYKGSKNGPGELCGVFTGRGIGKLEANTASGIYGTFTDKSFLSDKIIPVATADEVKVGKAQIVCTVDGEGPQFYNAEITKLYSSKDSANRNMVITVTDERLLRKTGGIVQGMSGSPIVQDSMLVGAVTHVFINDPAKGYGIFAENMLKTAEKIS